MTWASGSSIKQPLYHVSALCFYHDLLPPAGENTQLADAKRRISFFLVRGRCLLRPIGFEGLEK